MNTKQSTTLIILIGIVTILCCVLLITSSQKDSKVQHVHKTTQEQTLNIKTEYCIELLNYTGLCKVHSHDTDSIYIVNIDNAVEDVIMKENL